MVSSKWIFLDESGTEPTKAASAQGDYFALCAVAVDDPDATRTELGNLLQSLDTSQHGPGVDRVRARGYFHASDDTPKVRRYLLRGISDVSFHCQVSREPWISRPALSPYDARIADIFGTMGAPGKWTDTMHVVIARRHAQSTATGKGKQYQTLFVSVRKYLEKEYPLLAGEMPTKHTVCHVAYSQEPCLQLPDYCGWAVQRWLRYGDIEWLRVLAPKGPGWRDDQDRLVLPPDTPAMYVAADKITGVDFFGGV